MYRLISTMSCFASSEGFATTVEPTGHLIAHGQPG